MSVTRKKNVAVTMFGPVFQAPIWQKLVSRFQVNEINVRI